MLLSKCRVVSILVIYRPTGIVETPLMGLVGTLWPLSTNYVPTNPVVFPPTPIHFYHLGVDAM